MIPVVIKNCLNNNLLLNTTLWRNKKSYGQDAGF